MVQSLDPRRDRHMAKRAAIVAAAWDLARLEGLGGISLRALAERVGLRQPSLYSYFASKLDLYDAMFADGNAQLWTRIQALDLPKSPRGALRQVAHELLDFASEDPVRNELLFSRTVPGFNPSDGAFELAIEFDAFARRLMHNAGAVESDIQDAFVIILNGAANVQNANEPRGSRWTAHLDWMLDMYFREIDRRRRIRR